MEILRYVKEIKAKTNELKKQGKSIGFVPTMGYLHKGHISLIEKAKKENDIVIVSIFVNPTQFGPNEDYKKYPRDMERDSLLCKEAGTDIIFNPSALEMYPTSYMTYIDVENITHRLCGKSRPGHFKGVTTVVNKLFNITQANKAYFGQKDAQQVAVLQKMVEDLNMNIEIIPCPIVREADGIAMSSRNVYLTEEERKAASILHKTLLMAENYIKNGMKNVEELENLLIKNIKSEALASIDYVEIVNAKTLTDIKTLENEILIALAVYFGKTRLIDNLRMEV